MRPTQIARPVQAVAFLLLLAIALTLGACGHTEAAPPEVPMATVMQTIHDYGRGHQGTPAPIPSGEPETGTSSYSLHIRTLLDEGNYAELEKIAATNRTERGRSAAGDWKNNSFFNAVGTPVYCGDPNDSDYQQQFEKLNKWVAAHPESAAARIALAQLYIAYSEFARGTGTADTVSRKQWRQYNTRTAMAKQALLEAARLKERDPHWYFVMECVAHNEGWEKADMRELLDQALAFEPDYFHFYRVYANYLLPQWYGDPGELVAFAKDVAANHTEPAGSILYFQIVSSLACYCQGDIEDLRNADWPKLQLGFANLQRLYGLSDLNANRFAEMAYVLHDKAVAREAFSHVSQRDSGVWPEDENYQYARAWANNPDGQ